MKKHEEIVNGVLGLFKNHNQEKDEQYINSQYIYPEELLSQVDQAIEELQSARDCFDAVEDEQLIEYAIFRENAAIMKLSFLIKEAKINAALAKKIANRIQLATSMNAIEK